MVWRPRAYPGEPNRPEPHGRCPQHIIDRMIPDKPRVGRSTANLCQRMRKNPWIGLLHLDGFRNDDRREIPGKRELLDLGRLERHLAVRDDAEVNALRMERGQRCYKPRARHHRPRKPRLPMGTYT